MSSYLPPMQEGSIPRELAGTALDGAVRALFGLSWGRARELVRRGKVSVDGQTVTDPLSRVRSGAVVVVDPAAQRPRTNELPRENLVHVDPHVVVVEKPAGVDTVAFDPEGMGASVATRARPGEEAALDERVRAALTRRERGRNAGRNPGHHVARGVPAALGVVHRLDRETSGLLVFTRTWAAKKALMQEFRLHTVHRRYLAIVHGAMKSATFRTHFVPDRGDGLRGSVEHRHGRKHAIGSEKTQLAVTHVEVVERLPGTSASAPCTLVACVLETGRTHQIRIHLSEAGHPVVGDRVYTRDHLRDGGIVVAAPRLMLHAAELGFVHPATQHDVRWRSELPDDMRAVLERLRK